MYRKWSDGWIENGVILHTTNSDFITLNGTSGIAITFPKAYSSNIPMIIISHDRSNSGDSSVLGLNYNTASKTQFKVRRDRTIIQMQ